MEKKSQKISLPYYDLLIVQDLWQAHYLWQAHLLSSDMAIKNVKYIEINITIVTVFLNIQTLTMI